MTGATVNTAAYWAFIAELARTPATFERLLADHSADAARLCRSCTRPGTGLTHVRHPCPLARVARHARDVAAGKLTDRLVGNGGE